MEYKKVYFTVLLFIMLLISCNSALSVDTTNLISYWALENTTDSHGSNDLSVSGASQTTGKILNAYSFDGVNDYLYKNNVDLGYNTFSIGGWFKTDDGSNCQLPRNENAYHIVYGAGSIAQSYIGFANTGVCACDQLTLQVRTTDISTFTVNGGCSVNLTEFNPLIWYHVVGTFNGSTLKLYVNGIDRNVDVDGITGNINIDSSDDLWFGRRQDNTREFKGSLDEWFIYNKTLNDSEILQLYNEGLGIKYPFVANNPFIFNLTVLENITNNTLYNYNITLNNGYCFQEQTNAYFETDDYCKHLYNGSYSFNNNGNDGDTGTSVNIGNTESLYFNYSITKEVGYGTIWNVYYKEDGNNRLVTPTISDFCFKNNNILELRLRQATPFGRELYFECYDGSSWESIRDKDICVFCSAYALREENINLNYNYELLNTNVTLINISNQYNTKWNISITKNLYNPYSSIDYNLLNNLTVYLHFINYAPNITFNNIIFNNLTTYNLNNTPNNISYIVGSWDFYTNVTDVNLFEITYNLFNSTGNLIYNITTNNNTVLNLNDSYFRDFSESPFNLSITAVDTWGLSTTESILFYVFDNETPSCNGLENRKVLFNTTSNINIYCTDESLYSFNLSCDNGFNYFDSGFNYNNYSFINSTIILNNTICYYDICDGHTNLFLVKDWKIEKKDNKTIFKINNKINKFYSDNGKDDIKIFKYYDRYKFTVDFKNNNLDKTLYYQVSNNSNYFKSNKYNAWIIDYDSKTWFDLNNNHVTDFKVNYLSNGLYKIDFRTKQKSLEFESIGELNCLTGNFSINIRPFDIFGDLDLTTTEHNLFLLIFVILYISLCVIYLYTKNFIFGSFAFFTGVMLGLLLYNIHIFLTITTLLINIYLFIWGAKQ